METPEAADIIDDLIYELLEEEKTFQNKKIILLLLEIAYSLLTENFGELELDTDDERSDEDEDAG